MKMMGTSEDRKPVCVTLLGFLKTTAADMFYDEVIL